MNLIIYISIFLLCIVFYIHVLYHIKISQNENIFEVDYINKENIEEICNLRQPFTFQLQIPNISKDEIKKEFKINIIKKKKIEKENEDNEEKKEKIITYKYYSEYNKEIVNNNLINEKIKVFDKYIKPDFTFYNNYDIIISDENFKIPFISNYNFRNYYIVTEGTAEVEFISPKHNKYLNYNTDYELMQSNINNTINKKHVKITKIKVSAGDILYIPSRWWYSFNYTEPTTIIKYQYKTPMSIISNLPSYIYSYISIQKAIEKKENKDLINNKKLKI